MTASDTSPDGGKEVPDGKDTIILCDHCLTPVDPDEAVSDGIEDYHLECPKRKPTDGEVRERIKNMELKKGLPKAFIENDSRLTPFGEPTYAAYPAPHAAFPFVWFDIIIESGEREVCLALSPSDAKKWGEALVSAAEAVPDEE